MSAYINTYKYIIFGVLFGCLFPIFATVIDIINHDYQITLKMFFHIQSQQPLHWIIDTAPFFLGMFAAVAGYKKDRMSVVNSELEHKILELRESEIKYRNLVEKANDGIAIVQHRRIKFINPRLTEISGYTLDESLNSPVAKFIHPVHRRDTINDYLKFMRGELVIKIFETALAQKDGSKKYVEFNMSKTTYEGKPAVLVIVRDITDRKILHNQLIQAQKLESIGQLAAGIAHEINTPTQYVSDNTQFLQDSFTDIIKILNKNEELFSTADSGYFGKEQADELRNVIEGVDLGYLLEEIPTAIEQSLEGIDRIAHIVKAMKEFSHPGSKEKIPVDINKAIETTITVARNEWKYVAEIETDFDEELPLVMCMPNEFNQVILNIITNAAYAIGKIVGDGSNGKGIIKISTHYEGESTEIRISDTGTGIPAEIRDKIFDPFFTTKEIGKGTGQGLTISHSVITEKHGGTIDFKTTEGKGTMFIIQLPIGMCIT